ncbi:MAG: hypothetical protein NBV63_01105 [Candidatus Pacebacteria bacterium]|nr:hypothetical protein [Candidatus Paceibacterota bacterium]
MKEIKVAYQFVDKVMRKTKQVRVRDDLHAYLKDISNGGMTISKLADKAILLLKKEKEKNVLEYQHKMAILYPNRGIKNEHNVSKTQRVAELSTILRKIEKDLLAEKRLDGRKKLI